MIERTICRHIHLKYILIIKVSTLWQVETWADIKSFYISSKLIRCTWTFVLSAHYSVTWLLLYRHVQPRTLLVVSVRDKLRPELQLEYLKLFKMSLQNNIRNVKFIFSFKLFNKIETASKVEELVNVNCSFVIVIVWVYLLNNKTINISKIKKKQNIVYWHIRSLHWYLQQMGTVLGNLLQNYILLQMRKFVNVCDFFMLKWIHFDINIQLYRY